ncbi:MAG: GTPase ObgE, partial [Gammaproteobacteria bacterium]|nr:GTPase ObgE [Gammaproteobacteria bacterium]
PDGGDGGDGGHVYLVADSKLNTLSGFNVQRYFKAENGARGMGSQKTGRAGESLTISVPLGTKVYHAQTGELICDCVTLGDPILIAKGGFHGLGNARFKSSLNRAPRQTTPGYDGEVLELRLELQLLADVGLIGLPNAGKSSTIRCVSQARPKVADYPFTTLVPQLGVVHYGLGHDLVLADIPGLIEGAHLGHGLGTVFLRHLSRTKLLLFILDTKNAENKSCSEQYELLQRELQNSEYASMMVDKPIQIVFNKVDHESEMDSPEFKKQVKWFEKKGLGPVLFLSALQNIGADSLKNTLYQKFFTEGQ